MVQKVTQRCNAAAVAVDAMFVVGNSTPDGHAPLDVESQSDCDGHIIVHGFCNCFGDIHHLKNCSAMTAPHQRTCQGHDWQVERQALQARVAAGPADAVQNDVRVLNGREEPLSIEARQENAIVLRLQAKFSECSLKPPFERWPQ